MMQGTGRIGIKLIERGQNLIEPGLPLGGGFGAFDGGPHASGIIIALRASWLALAVPAAALVAFGLSLTGSFHFDDYSLFSDPLISSPQGWYEVFEPLHTRPLTYLTFWINHQLGGSNPFGYHLVNLLLHAACAFLVLRCLEKLIPARAAWIGALIFAIHPIQTEPVNYVFARSTLLMTLFVLLSCRAWLSGRAWVAVAWFGAALLSKEECVTFPLFLALLEWTRSRRWRPIAWMLALALAAGLRTMWATRVIAGSGAGVGAGISPFEYASMQGIAILRYLRLIVIPWGFTVDADLGTPATWLRIAAWIGVALLAGLALWRIKGAGLWLLGGLILLAASSTLFPAADLAVDRRMYLPMLAFTAAIGLILEHRTVWVVGLAVVLAAVSLHYSQAWTTEESLWREAVAQAPLKVRPKRQLARATGPAEARLLLEEAKGLAPEDPGVASDLGRLYLRQGNPALALGEFGRALALLPTDAGAISDRASALAGLGDAATAKLEYGRALKFDRCYAGALYALRKLGEPRPIPSDCRYSAEVKALLESR